MFSFLVLVYNNNPASMVQKKYLHQQMFLFLTLLSRFCSWIDIND